jgi:hypothetical protein
MDFQHSLAIQELASKESLIQKQRDELDYLEKSNDDLKNKVVVYERFLHALQTNIDVTMNNDNVRALLRNACSWSYAHREGNGELTKREQQDRINSAFNRLLDY